MKLKSDAKFEVESTSFQNGHREFDRFWPEHSKVSLILTLMDFFCGNYILFKLKRVERSYLEWNWRVIQNLERNQLAVSKLTEGIWQILTWALKSFTNFHFNGLLLTKVFIVQAKKVLRIYLSWNWRGIQNLEWKQLAVSKLTYEIWKFWPEHFKVSTSFTLMGFFWAKYILLKLNMYIRVIFHETEEGCKIWSGIDFVPKLT